MVFPECAKVMQFIINTSKKTDYLNIILREVLSGMLKIVRFEGYG